MVKKKPAPGGWRSVLSDFQSRFEIDSKESGRVVMKPWGTQSYFVDQLAAGMDEGIRFFIGGKGRQYGITTQMIPIDVLWCLVHPGIDGAIIANTLKVAEHCRGMVRDICTRLPESHRLKVANDTKDFMRWENDSTLHFLVAGTTERKTDLAKGHGLSLIHGSEVGEWGSEVAFNSLVASLAQKNPNRLYVFESTGEGSNNLFARLWRKSLDDPERKCIFIPWWTHDLYRLDRRTKLYAHYMANPEPTDDELQIIGAAKSWGHELGDDQLAWYRATCNRMTTNEEVRKNYPSVAEDMFQLGASAFIPGKPIRAAKDRAAATDFDAYSIRVGNALTDMKLIPLGKAIDEDDGHARGADLRVWSEPKPRGTYCIAVQPADEDGVGRAIEVLRCFADGIEQVAEYASDSVSPYQLAWVTCYLAGWYRECWINIDLDEGGRALFREIANLRNQESIGEVNERFFGEMIFYLYNRIDNVNGASRTWNWEWNADNERESFGDFKGSFLAGRLMVHSLPLLEEMTTLVNDDGHIGADDGSDDARARAMCIGLRTYVDHVRLAMQANKRTREHDLRQDTGAATATFLEDIVDSFIARGMAAAKADSETDWRR
jgi:hypothetical protein